MVALALSDTRLRNYYDIWLLSRSFKFDENQFGRAVLLSFIRRDTSSPKEIPDDMTTAFGDDDAKQRQWDAFIRDVSHIPGLVFEVIQALTEFLMPAASIAAGQIPPLKDYRV